MEKAQISSKISKPFCFYVFFSLRTVINEEYGDVTECLTGHVKSANIVRVCNTGQRVPENSSLPETTIGEQQPGTAIPSHGCIGHLTGCRWWVWLPSAAESPYFFEKAQNKHCISFPRARSTLGVCCWCVKHKLHLTLVSAAPEPFPCPETRRCPAACPKQPAPPRTASAPSAHTFIYPQHQTQTP